MTLAEALSQLGERWRSSEGRASAPERRLLRLALLREASRRCHAELSRLLVRGGRDQAWETQALESRLSRLRFHPTLALAWGSWEVGEMTDGGAARDEGATTHEPERVTLPPTLAALNLERHDRLWELSLVLAARAADWQVFRWGLAVTHESIDAFARALDLTLWPEAIFLCTLPTTATSPAVPAGSWGGDWYFAAPTEARLCAGARAFLDEHGARELGAPARLA